MNNQFISRYNAGDTQFARTDSLNGHWPDEDEGSILIYCACFVIGLIVLGGLCLVATL